MWKTTCVCRLMVPICSANETGFSNVSLGISFGQLIYTVLG